MTTEHTSFEEDYTIVAACRSGDSEAWNQLVGKYERLVYSIPLQMGLNREDAADITQITFTILLRNLNVIRDDMSLAAWLRTVAERQSWRLIRLHNRAQTKLLDEDHVIRDISSLLGRTTDAAIDQIDLSHWINAGLSKLKTSCRELLAALYLDERELSYGEVANKLGIPLGSIGPMRARCLEALRRFLKE